MIWLVPPSRYFSGRVHHASLLAQTSKGRGSPQSPRCFPSWPHAISSWGFCRLLLAQGHQSTLVGRPHRRFIAPAACARRPCRELRSPIVLPAAGRVLAGYIPVCSLLGPVLAVAPVLIPGAPLASVIHLPPLPPSLALHGSSCRLFLALEPYIATHCWYNLIQLPLVSLPSYFDV